MREKLKGLASHNSSSKDPGLVAWVEEAAGVIVSKLSTPSLLLCQDGLILATTTGAEYTAGATLRAQTTPQDLEIVQGFEALLERTGFWEAVDLTVEYEYSFQGEERWVQATALEIGGQIYCLMQKATRNSA